ncbi:MAG: c-type cytochrome domain-containing protein, partial [Planctomycetota bacterium]
MAIAASFFCSFSGLLAADGRVEFNRDIRPILSDNCFSCHGPDEKTRQAGLRLDLVEQARTKLVSGKTALVPGKVADSELARRIVATDPNERMPPIDAGKHLTAGQIELLKRWIEQGAEYQAHWS